MSTTQPQRVAVATLEPKAQITLLQDAETGDDFIFIQVPPEPNPGRMTPLAAAWVLRAGGYLLLKKE